MRDLSRGLKPNAVVVISQNEQGIIKKGDPLYVGLITHSIVDCVGVIISNSSKAVHALQHHDMHTDTSCIKEAITNFLNEDSGPSITLVINKHQLERENRGYDENGRMINGYEITNRVGGTFHKIKTFLETNGLPYEILETMRGSDGKGGITSNNGVFVDQDGNIDLAQTLINRYLCGNFWRPGADRPAISCDLDKNSTIANLRFFKGEKSQIFTRYDGETLNKEVQPLTRESENYLQTLYDGGFRNASNIERKLHQDNDTNVFGEDDLTKSRVTINAQDSARNIESIFRERDEYLDRLQFVMKSKEFVKKEGGKIVCDQNWYQQLGEPFKQELQKELGIPNTSFAAVDFEAVSQAKTKMEESGKKSLGDLKTCRDSDRS